MVSFESIQRVSFVCRVASWIGLFIWISENLICMSCVVDRISAVCYVCRCPRITSEKKTFWFVPKQELSQSIIISMNSGPDDSPCHSEPSISKPPKLHTTHRSANLGGFTITIRSCTFFESWNVFVLAKKPGIALRGLQSLKNIKEPS